MFAIFDPEIDKSDIGSHSEKLEGIIGNFGGEVLRTDDWGLRDFSYPIKKKKSGHYMLYYFEADTDAPHKIRDAIRLDEDVLRHMILVSEHIPADLKEGEE
mgnify:CR=1 FL=1